MPLRKKRLHGLGQIWFDCSGPHLGLTYKLFFPSNLLILTTMSSPPISTRPLQSLFSPTSGFQHEYKTTTDPPQIQVIGVRKHEAHRRVILPETIFADSFMCRKIPFLSLQKKNFVDPASRPSTFFSPSQASQA